MKGNIVYISSWVFGKCQARGFGRWDAGKQKEERSKMENNRSRLASC